MTSDRVEVLRELIARDGVAQLVVTDLVRSDLGHLDWSGSPTHIAAVARQLDRAERGEVEYLAVRAPGGTLIAKAAIDYADEQDSGSIFQVVTRAELRGLGVGTLLMFAAEARIRARGRGKARLGVERDNSGARSWYERLGYGAVGERTDSWEAEREDGSVFTYEAAITDMEKHL